jgi:hypothetical protein
VQGVVADVEGWMTPGQARRLWTCARTVRPGGLVVEIGSFRGRSMIVLASAAEAGVSDRVTHVRKFSNEALADVPGEIDLLYIDGAHRFRPALDDIRRWGDKVRPGGDLLIHDSFSSLGVTLALVASRFFSGGWRYLGRSESMTHYRREPVRGASRLRNLGRQLASLPWFLRNLVIKALILAKLGRLTQPLFGHDPATWPH